MAVEILALVDEANMFVSESVGDAIIEQIQEEFVIKASTNEGFCKMEGMF